MAISPPSDIVLDALNAADPATRVTRTAQLAQLGPARTHAPAPAGMPFHAASEAIARRNSVAITPTAATPAQPYRQFESMVLQNFVAGMLPGDDTQAFGQGTAGSVARSWMAEAIAKQIAGNGGIGIADAIAARHSPATAPTPAAEPLATPTTDDGNPFARLLNVMAQFFAGPSEPVQSLHAGLDRTRISR
jgi:hypothetical protein